MLNAYDSCQEQPQYQPVYLTPWLLICSLLMLLWTAPAFPLPPNILVPSLNSENTPTPHAGHHAPDCSPAPSITLKDFRDKQQAAEKNRQQYQQRQDKLLQRLNGLKDKLAKLEQSSPEPLLLSDLQRQQRMLQASDQLLSYGLRLQELMEQLTENAVYLKDIPQRLTESEKSIKIEKEVLKNMEFSSANYSKSAIEKQQEKINYHYVQKGNLLVQKNYYHTETEVINLEIDYVNKQHQLLTLRQQEDGKLLLALELMPEQQELLRYLEDNRLLVAEILQQQKLLKTILSEQRAIDDKLFHTKREQYQLESLASWKISKPKTIQKFRSRILKLTTPPDLRQILREISKLDEKKNEYENRLEQEKKTVADCSYTTHLSGKQTNPLRNEQVKFQGLLVELIKTNETITEQFDGLCKKKPELIQHQQHLQTKADSYLFWEMDANPLSSRFPMLVVKDIQAILHNGNALATHLRSVVPSGRQILLFSLAFTVLLLGWSARRKHLLFLQRAAARIGNVTQDSFSLTTATIGWALGTALPLPLMLMAIGQILQDSALEPLSSALRTIAPPLWGLQVCANFAHPQGVFIRHFGWDARKVSRISRYYLLAAWVILPLMVLNSLFNQFEEQRYAETLGRTTFFLLCVILWSLGIGIKHTGVTFYLTKKASAQNFLNRLLWMLLLGTPLLANLFAMFGYVTASQELLFRLAGSIAIWFTLFIVYHLAWRWMLIQRRRLAFERAKQRRASKLAQRTRVEDELTRMDPNLEIQLLDLETMSSRSLQLLRSIIAMATLMALIAWWSKIHPAFGFLENFPLWHVDTISQGMQTIQAVTLKDMLKAILFIVITTQLVRNFPAVLELVLLQHLDLTQGTSYAVTSVTKYLLTLIGGLVVIYLLGIDWPKIQWVATALGVGLGFGLKDIFANFISGLILLFEKPIRIGDTVTVKDFHGTVTRINTRATVITDWDRKEIIIPNHTLVIEQFINWTLSDTVIRLVLQLAAPATVDPKLIKKLFKQATKKCTLLLVNPPPEIYLNDLQQGVQIFEIRLYTAEPAHRMLLRHEFHERILFLYRKHQITLPYPPTQVRIEAERPSSATTQKSS